MSRKLSILKLLKENPTDDDKFLYLEQGMMVNAALSLDHFEKNYRGMTAIEAAKAATMFAGKALEIKKGRENGFKEPPINVGIILKLEKTLTLLTNGEK